MTADSGPCDTWVDHDLSAFINVDDQIHTGGGAPIGVTSVAAYSGGNLHATTLNAFGQWDIALPDIYLPADHRFMVEITFDSGDTYAPGGADSFILWALDAIVGYTITNEIGSDTTSVNVGHMWTTTLDAPPDGSAPYLNPQFKGLDTHVTQIRTMLLCPLVPTHGPVNLGIPPLRQGHRSDGRGAWPVLRLWPPSRSIQASNRRAGGYL